MGMNHYKVGTNVRVLRTRNNKGVYYDAVIINRCKGKDGKYTYDVTYGNGKKEIGVCGKRMKRDFQYSYTSRSAVDMVSVHGALATMNVMF